MVSKNVAEGYLDIVPGADVGICDRQAIAGSESRFLLQARPRNSSQAVFRYRGLLRRAGTPGRFAAAARVPPRQHHDRGLRTHLELDDRKSGGRHSLHLPPEGAITDNIFVLRALAKNANVSDNFGDGRAKLIIDALMFQNCWRWNLGTVALMSMSYWRR